MRRFLELWANEPAVVVGVVSAILALAGAFGLFLDEKQTAAIVGAVSAVGAVIGSFIVRSQVTPVK